MGKTLIQRLPTWLLLFTFAALISLWASHARAAGCQQFFVKQYHHAYAQAVVAVPLIYSTVSPSLVNEAQIRAIAREELRQELRAALTAPRQHQQAQQVQQKPQQAYGVLAQKCSRCHQGAKPKGDILLDGTAPIHDGLFRRIAEMLGENIDVPDEMKQVVSSLKPEDKGAIFSEMIRMKPALAVQQPVKQEPEFVPPPPDGLR